jgi:hypothetical protein
MIIDRPLDPAELQRYERDIGDPGSFPYTRAVPPGRRDRGRSPYIALWVAAMRGREPETLDLIRATSHEATARGEGYVMFVTEHVTAVLYNGLGRYSEALDALRRQTVDVSYGDRSPRPMAELVEAAVRSGERQLAGLALERLAETTSAAGTDWALGIQARSRALLSDGAPAEALYRDAIERLSRTSIRVQLARAHLLYGE